MTGLRNGFLSMVLTALLLAAAGRPDPVAAGETRTADPGPEAEAARLVEDVLGRAEDGDREAFGAWTRSIVERALERAPLSGESLSGPHSGSALPAERHAGELPDSPLSGMRGTSDILIFMSLSVPAASWRQWARDSAAAGVPLLLRGVGDGGLPGTAKRIGERLGGAEAGVAIDPRLFRLFGVTRVPAVVVAPGGVPPCRSRGCAEDPAPPHDRVTGNISLVAALEAIAGEGDAGREAAKAVLERLEGDWR
ncbi:MAG: type-F conjugative transfer system pilin assembly protein TrbC [Rhodospirillales bacterium]|nr:type-F conjugative transfer system pilin assembly protein TrbC [Rhodospirillales bacterium]